MFRDGLGNPLVLIYFPDMDLCETEGEFLSSSDPPVCKHKSNYLFPPKMLSENICLK